MIVLPERFTSFNVRFGSFQLNSLFCFSDVEELRVGAVYVSEYVMPFLDVEHRVGLRNFTDDYPVFSFSFLLFAEFGRVSIIWHLWRLFEANRTHIVVVAVVDKSFAIVA